MHHTELGPLLMKRLAARPQLIDELLEFTGLRISTVRDWLKDAKERKAKPQYPRGETLNRIWYFLDAADIASPELKKLPAFGAYLGKLMAYGVVKMEEAQEYCGGEKPLKPQAVLSIIRGERQRVQARQAHAAGSS